MYPHQCPECSAAAYIGGDQLVRCTNEACCFVDPDLDIGKLEREYKSEWDAAWEDEDTLPQFDFGSIQIKWP